jgi:dienelactone hydrolase
VLYWVGVGLPTVITALLALALYGWIRERQLPPPPGPFPVGRATFDWTDFGGPTVVVWYPAEKPSRDSVAAYMPGLFGDEMLRGRGPFSQRLGFLTDRAYPAGTLRGIRPPLPLVIWSPDWGLQPTAYAVLAEDLASRGYVVMGAGPSDSTGPKLRPARVAARVADLHTFLIRIQRLKDADVGLFSRLGTERVALVGHGVGGEASVRACAVERHCAAAVDLDGDVAGDGPVMAGPVLFLAAGHGPLPDAPAAFPRALGVRIRGLPDRHLTDEAVFFQPLAWVQQLFGQLEGVRGLRIVGAYVATFLDEHLRGATVSWLPTPRGFPKTKVEFNRDH